MSAPPAMGGFTLDALDWASWLETVDVAAASPEQIAVLEKSLPSAKTSPYYLLLVHDVEALSQRSSLFNAVMYGPRGLSRPERELATVVVSLINGCPYCVSVHARRFVELTKQPEVMRRLLGEGLDIPLDARRRAIVDFSAMLTRAPERLTAADLAPLRAVGLSDLEILDVVHAVAMFAWANRLMQTLGEPVVPTKAG